MKWGKARALAAFAIVGLSLAPAALTSCMGDGPGANATDASYGSVFKDAGGSTVDTSAPLVCAPVLPDAWAPPAFEPPVIGNTSCTPQQIQTFYDACFSASATQTACDSFYNARVNAVCDACMYTPFGQAPPRGAILQLENGVLDTNYSGCMALIDGDLSETGCAAKVQAAANCENAACAENCPLDNSSTAAENASVNAFNACTSKADDVVCDSEIRLASYCASDAKYDACNFGNGFEAYAIGIANLMCASGIVTDAGIADASDDASDAADADVSDAEDDASDAADD